jgi:hypothetical protein
LLGDFSLAEDYYEFASRLVQAEDPADYLDKVLVWNAKVLTPNKPKEVMAFLLKFLATASDEFLLAHYKPLLKTAYLLSAEYSSLALDCFGTSVKSLPGEVSVRGLMFVELTGLICDINEDSTLRSIVHAYLAVQYLTAEVKDPGLWTELLTVHWVRWLDRGRYYSPEWSFGLIKLAEATVDQAAVLDLVHSASAAYSKLPGFGIILNKLSCLVKETISKIDYTPLQLKPQSVQEIESLEPALVQRISTANKARDPNKQHNETRALKAELKKSQKSARKVLAAEGAVIVKEKQREAELLSSKKKLERHRAFQAIEESEREIKLLKTEQGPRRPRKEKKRRTTGEEA